MNEQANNNSVRKLAKFDGIKIEKIDENSENERMLKELMENENFVHETQIKKIEKRAAKVRKPLKNYTILTADQKVVMGNALANEIHINVDFSFHGYLEMESEIVMVTTVKSITE